MAVVTEIGLEIRNMLPATFTAPGLTEAQFLKLCEEFPDALLEYTADGRVIVMPPTDPENGVRIAEVLAELANWARKHKRGMVTGPDAGFFFRDGSRRSPDAAWFDSGRWKAANVLTCGFLRSRLISSLRFDLPGSGLDHFTRRCWSTSPTA